MSAATTFYGLCATAMLMSLASVVLGQGWLLLITAVDLVGAFVVYRRRAWRRAQAPPGNTTPGLDL